MHFQHNHLNEIICFLMSSMVEKKNRRYFICGNIAQRKGGGVVARSTLVNTDYLVRLFD